MLQKIVLTLIFTLIICSNTLANDLTVNVHSHNYNKLISIYKNMNTLEEASKFNFKLMVYNYKSWLVNPKQSYLFKTGLLDTLPNFAYLDIKEQHYSVPLYNSMFLTKYHL